MSDGVAIDGAKDKVIASTRARQWMEIGTVVEDKMTVEEALKAGDLDWSVEKRKLYLENAKGNKTLVKDRFAIVRTDTEQPLGIVGSHYAEFQNRSALSWANIILEQEDDALIDAVFSQRGGKVVGVVVGLPEGILVAGEDAIRFDLLIRTSHDGSKAISAYISAINQRCTNQEALALSAAMVKQRWSIQHVSTATERLAEATSALQLTHKYREEFARVAEQLADSQLAIDEFRDMLEMILPDRPKTPEVIDAIQETWETSPNISETLRPTQWGALQGITEYFDWGRQTRSAEARFHASIDGPGYQVRNRAAQLMLNR